MTGDFRTDKRTTRFYKNFFTFEKIYRTTQFVSLSIVKTFVWFKV